MPGKAEEVRLARAALDGFFKAFSRVQVCESNHAMRPSNRSQDPTAGCDLQLAEQLGQLARALDRIACAAVDLDLAERD